MTAQNISWWGFVFIAIILLGFAALVLWKFFSDKTALIGLISEPDQSKASLSRFQFLIFTFVVAGLFLLLSIEAGTFVEIPTNVLGLLGISSGTYLVAKAVPPASTVGGSTTQTTEKRTTETKPGPV